MGTYEIATMSCSTIYRRYLWRHSKKEWVCHVIKMFSRRIRLYVIIFILLFPIFLTYDTLADGTNDRQYIFLQIEHLKSTLPIIEEAFRDIDNLGNSISKISYKDPDICFIYAFLITKWAMAYDLDPIEVASIAFTESEFNHKAVSKKDARGLMQIHKPTWEMNDYFDAEENIRKGAQILYIYKKSYPSLYLKKYSGGEPGYAKKVKRNMERIRKTS